ncbi:MAG: RluA family pseudouridine synthase [Flavobacteriales bacterium]|nr:RluA family pseudouridine synthase [Flavobacteriales bacterium]
MNKIGFNTAIQKATTPLPGSVAERITYKLSVKKKYEGLSIVDFFLKAVPRSTEQIWLDKLDSDNLKINRKSITKDYKVTAGEVAIHQSEPKTEPPISTNINLVYEDDEIIVLDKPSPHPVHASGRFVRNTLISILDLAFTNKVFKLLHRIDANTTGIIVLAKNKIAANLIQQQFENKTIKKTYAALVEGILTDDYLNLQQGIGTEVLVGGARKIDSSGKIAQTKIEVLERRKNTTLLKVTPLTGRTNQIRLHLAELKHPIVGDIGHKDKTYFENNPFTYKTDSLFLHAHQLTIVHPTTKKEITFIAPIPEKFNS